MLTWLIMQIQKIEGANLVLIVCAAAWIIFLGLFIVIKANRGKSQFKTAFITGGVLTLICDIIWFFKFFDNFEYLNPGFGGVIWLFILPGAMLFAVMFLSYVNASRYEFDKEKREKEKAKQRKKEKRLKKAENKNEE